MIRFYVFTAVQALSRVMQLTHCSADRIKNTNTVAAGFAGTPTRLLQPSGFCGSVQRGCGCMPKCNAPANFV